MKFTTLLWITLLTVTATSLSANEQLSIDQRITSIQKASPQERVKLMNQFKQQLASMNAQERSKSIAHLRKEMNTNEQHEDHSTNKEMRNEAQHDQMQQSERMQRMEQMQQRHGGDQAKHEMKKEMGGMNDQFAPPKQQH